MQLLVVDGAGMRHRDLELRALRGQRAAQVVGDVGDEPALPLAGLLEPREHPVHRRREPADLVAAVLARPPAATGRTR